MPGGEYQSVTIEPEQLLSLKPRTARTPETKLPMKIELVDGSRLSAGDFEVKDGQVTLTARDVVLSGPAKAIAIAHIKAETSANKAAWDGFRKSHAAKKFKGDVLVITKGDTVDYFEGVLYDTGKDKDGKLAFPPIPGGVLTLLGISGSSFAVGKAIQFSDPAGIEDRPVTVTITPAKAAVHYKATQQFKADVARKPDAKVHWAVVAGPGTVDADTGLYSAPAAAEVPPAPYATVQATCVDYPDVTDLAVIMLA